MKKNLKKQKYEESFEILEENNNPALVQVTGNYNNMGIIKRVNSELTVITGYKKDDLIGQSLSIIQPKCISDTHGYILKYLVY